MPRPKGTSKPNIPIGRTATPLRPLPLRVSFKTYERFERLRELDGLTLQEHVRYALEYYLDHVEVSIALSASEAMTKAIDKVREVSKENDVPPRSILKGLLAKHAPAPQRAQAPKVTVK